MSKRAAFVLLACLPLLISAAAEPRIEVFFSPKGGCTEATVRELNRAKSSVRVQAYSFTSGPITKALIEAHRRGRIRGSAAGQIDQTDRYSGVTSLMNASGPARIDAAHEASEASRRRNFPRSGRQ
jgi:hypothetical protein